MGSNIANVFGIKFFKSLLPIDFVLDEAIESSDNQDPPYAPRKRVVGYISKVGIGVGRSDNDRQFFYINGRPFDLHQVKKVVNDVWRQYEMKQKPACVLDFRLPLKEYDVNVTPDKRETFIKNVCCSMTFFRIDDS
jgi:DNA mismatch repair protein PMS2